MRSKLSVNEQHLVEEVLLHQYAELFGFVTAPKPYVSDIIRDEVRAGIHDEHEALVALRQQMDEFWQPSTRSTMH